MIGGLWLVVGITILLAIYASVEYTVSWAWPSYLPYQLATGIMAIVGVIIRFKNIKVGSIILLIAGIFYPIFVLIIAGPLSVIYVLFNSLVRFNFIEIPYLILLIGGIVGFIEWFKGE